MEYNESMLDSDDCTDLSWWLLGDGFVAYLRCDFQRYMCAGGYGAGGLDMDNEGYSSCHGLWVYYQDYWWWGWESVEDRRHVYWRWLLCDGQLAYVFRVLVGVETCLFILLGNICTVEVYYVAGAHTV
jgi:hypothetical protein